MYNKTFPLSKTGDLIMLLTTSSLSKKVICINVLKGITLFLGSMILSVSFIFDSILLDKGWWMNINSLMSYNKTG